MHSNFDLAPGQWTALRRLLDEALALAPPQRAHWIARLPAEHEPLKARLHALLEAAARSAVALPFDTLPRFETAQILARAPGTGATADAPGDRIGPYRLVRRIAEGGMGSVWLAERADGLVDRPVALKLPRLLDHGAALAQRLARERGFLAALNHPHIARLYDAGVTAEGRPYLALEYVEGERIDAYCNSRALDTSARLALFIQVAMAVAHAHARLIVHRDLKPANILVNADGEVRLLDFGIAKLLEEGGAQETELTQLAGRALTPDYASPEQIADQPIGVGSDIYSLGVVLFELLTGSRPYQLKRDTRAALEEAILAADAPRPSAVSTDHAARKALRGDLDTIVLKALKKSPEQRYATAHALVEDIERYRAGRPVLAQPDSRVYRLRKFVARNRLAVAAAASLLIAVLAGAGVSMWQARVAIAEKKRADEVKEFIAAIFRDANPWSGPGKALSAQELLKQAQAKVERGLPGRPELRAELFNLLIVSFNGLQDYLNSEAIARHAIEDATRSLGAHHRLTLEARALFTSVQRFRGIKVAPADLDALLSELRTHAPGAGEAQLEVLRNRAHIAIDQGRNEDAEAAAREALAFATANFGDGDRRVAATRLLTAVALQHAGKHEQALPAAEDALRQVLRYVDGNRTHPSAIDARGVYARALANAGRVTEGIAELIAVIDDVTAVIGATAPMGGYYSADAARYMLQVGDTRGALAYSERALRILSTSAAPGSLTHGAALGLRGGALMAARRESEALAPLQEALNALQPIVGSSHPRIDSLRVSIPLARGLQGDLVGSIAVLDGLAAELRTRNPRQSSSAWAAKAALLRLSDRPRLALDAFRQAAQALPPAPGIEIERRRIDAETLLVRLDLGQAAEAAAELSRLQQTLPLQPANPIEADLFVGLGRARMMTARAESALRLLVAADAFWREFDAANRSAGEAAFWLAKCNAALGRAVDAKQAYARAAQILAGSPLPADAKLARLARRAAERA